MDETERQAMQEAEDERLAREMEKEEAKRTAAAVRVCVCVRVWVCV